jgi:hypothetical protein
MERKRSGAENSTINVIPDAKGVFSLAQDFSHRRIPPPIRHSSGGRQKKGVMIHWERDSLLYERYSKK